MKREPIKYIEIAMLPRPREASLPRRPMLAVGKCKLPGDAEFAYMLIDYRPGEAPDGTCAYDVIAKCETEAELLALVDSLPPIEERFIVAGKVVSAAEVRAALAHVSSSVAHAVLVDAEAEPCVSCGGVAATSTVVLLERRGIVEVRACSKCARAYADTGEFPAVVLDSRVVK